MLQCSMKRRGTCSLLVSLVKNVYQVQYSTVHVFHKIPVEHNENRSKHKRYQSVFFPLQTTPFFDQWTGIIASRIAFCYNLRSPGSHQHQRCSHLSISFLNRFYYNTITIIQTIVVTSNKGTRNI